MRLRSLAVAATVVASAAGCGEARDGADQEAQAAGPVRVGSVSQLAQCRDWLAASEDERIATIEDIRQQINTGDAGVQNVTLTNDQAYGVFEGACGHDYAVGFRLYKLYFRAAAFEPLLEPADG